ncbi:MAG: hypothetical protein JWM47_1404 [Acidimicrobiales bacterium]|nr:hypothetical protein [Acidimicrobiales bacterium]
MPVESFVDHGVLNARFTLTVDKFGEVGWFSSVSGLGMEVEVLSHPEGGQNGFIHKFPGQMKWTDLTLRSGLTNSDVLFNWIQETAADRSEKDSAEGFRSTVAIQLLKVGGEIVQSWNVEGAFPIRWSGPTLDVNQYTEAQEELVLAHHGFTTKSE